MNQRRLGASGPEVGAIGLGCMGMSWIYREAERDDEASIAVIHEAIERGATLLDTADIYGDGHNESLVGRAIADRREQAVVATKLGLVVDDLAGRVLHRDASPEHVHAAAHASLRRLGTDTIDLLYLHRIDPQVPLADTWGAMSELVEAGVVRQLGLSEVSIAEAEEAAAIHPVAAIQSELSLWTRDPLGEIADSEQWVKGGDDIVTWCAEHDVAFVPFAPLGRGYLTGTISRADFTTEDFRAHSPRFTPDNLTSNARIADTVRKVAAEAGVTPAQLAIAWVLARGPHVIPIPGTKKQHYLEENIAACDVRLTEDHLRELNQLPAPAGTRY